MDTTTHTFAESVDHRLDEDLHDLGVEGVEVEGEVADGGVDRRHPDLLELVQNILEGKRLSIISWSVEKKQSSIINKKEKGTNYEAKQS